MIKRPKIKKTTLLLHSILIAIGWLGYFTLSVYVLSEPTAYLIIIMVFYIIFALSVLLVAYFWSHREEKSAKKNKESAKKGPIKQNKKLPKYDPILNYEKDLLGYTILINDTDIKKCQLITIDLPLDQKKIKTYDVELRS